MDLLKQYDPDMLVVLSKDAEGNGFSELDDYSTIYNYNTEEHEIGIRTLTEDLSLSGYTEEDVMEDGEPCIILWP